MSPSWWITFVISIGALVYACYEHNEIWSEFKAAHGRACIKTGIKLFLLWFVPVGGLVATLIGALEAKASEKQLAALDPLNQPVSEIGGNAAVELAGGFRGLPPRVNGLQLNSSVTLMETNVPPYTLAFGGFNVLYVSGDTMGHTTTSDGPTTHGYVMELKRHTGWAHGPVQIIENWAIATAGMVSNRINYAELRLEFVPPEAEIVGGFVEFFINGTIKKRLSIPKQISATHGTFYATNILAR